jgi:DnaJ family protein C protein 28
MDWGKLVEQKIREAQEAGDFENLPKKGQLSNEDESSVPEDMRLAFHMLKTQGFAPQWIEQDKALRNKLDQARQTIVRSWLWYRSRLDQSPTHEERAAAEHEWLRARKQFAEAIDLLNREVFSFNLRVPSIHLQRLPLRLSEEYQALGIKG